MPACYESPPQSYLIFASRSTFSHRAASPRIKADATRQTFVNDDSGHDVMIDQPQWLADVLPKVS